MPRSIRLILASWTFLLAVSPYSAAADRYVEAKVDSAGSLRILTASGRTIVLKKEFDQVGFEKIAISADGSSVGWCVLYPNGATSYPIPLKLMIYTGGKLRTFKGSGLPVWRWHYTNGANQVAFEQETVHGGLGIHYELVDTRSGRRIAEYTPEVGPDSRPLPNQTVPKWVSELDAH